MSHWQARERAVESDELRRLRKENERLREIIRQLGGGDILDKKL